MPPIKSQTGKEIIRHEIKLTATNYHTGGKAAARRGRGAKREERNHADFAVNSHPPAATCFPTARSARRSGRTGAGARARGAVLPRRRCSELGTRARAVFHPYSLPTGCGLLGRAMRARARGEVSVRPAGRTTMRAGRPHSRHACACGRRDALSATTRAQAHTSPRAPRRRRRRP